MDPGGFAYQARPQEAGPAPPSSLPPWRADYAQQQQPQPSSNLPPWRAGRENSMGGPYPGVGMLQGPSTGQDYHSAAGSHGDDRGSHRHHSRSNRSRSRSRSRSRGRHRRRSSSSEDSPRRRHRRSRSHSRHRRHRSRSHSRGRHHGSRSRERRRRSPDWKHDMYEDDDDHHGSDHRRGRSGSGTYDSWREGSSGRDDGGSRWRDVAPTSTLFVKGIPDTCNESDVSELLAAYPDITGIRVVRDKHTGAHRGFGFIDFASVDSARRLMEGDDRATLSLQGSKLRLDYTTASQAHGGAASRGASDTSASLDWMCDMCSSINFARRLECYQCAAVRPAAPRRVGTEGRARAFQDTSGGASGWAPKEFTDSATNENGQNSNPPTTAEQQGSADYVYDAATGYYWMPSIEAYYDSQTTLYFFRSTNQWCQLDTATNTYVPVEQQAAAAGVAAQGGAGWTAAAAVTGAAAPGAAIPAATAAAAVTTQPKKPAKGAVIGAAPQYNPHALLLAAQAIEVPKAKGTPSTYKPPTINKPAAANKPKGPNSHVSSAAKPGLGSGAAAPPPKPQPASAPSAGQGGAPGSQPVAGVIHRSRWAQNRGAAQ